MRSEGSARHSRTNQPSGKVPEILPDDIIPIRVLSNQYDRSAREGLGREGQVLDEGLEFPTRPQWVEIRIDPQGCKMSRMLKKAGGPRSGQQFDCPGGESLGTLPPPVR